MLHLLDTLNCVVLKFCSQSVVQVETLGEVGVFFTLFLVGLEFSPERLRKVRASPSCVIAANLNIIWF